MKAKAKVGIVILSDCAWKTLSDFAKQRIEAMKEVKLINRFCGCGGCVKKLSQLNNAYEQEQSEANKADILRQIKEFRAVA